MAVFLDFETTGLNRDGRDEVVEVGIIDQRGNVLVGELVRPVRNQTWPGAQRIHGISPADVAGARTFEQVAPDILEAIRDEEVGIYNASYDMGFMTQAMLNEPRRIICVMTLFQQAYPRERWTLQNAMQVCGWRAVQTHRAADDCTYTKFVWDTIEGRFGGRFAGMVARATM